MTLHWDSRLLGYMCVLVKENQCQHVYVRAFVCVVCIRVQYVRISIDLNTVRRHDTHSHIRTYKQQQQRYQLLV